MSEPAWPLGALAEAGPGSGRFDVEARDEICNTRGLLFGGWGAGLMAAVAAHRTGGHVLDLSVSFLRPIPAGRRLVITRTALAAGRTLSHYSVTAYPHSGEAEQAEPVLVAAAVVGPVEEPLGGGPAPPGPVPAPDDCAPRDFPAGSHAGVGRLVDVRVARVTAKSALLWGRLLCDVPAEVRLAVLSDHVPYMVRKTLPGPIRSTTVSGSLRVLSTRPADWYLLDVSLVSHADRTAVGRVSMWAGGVALAGVAEQTTRLIR